MSDFDKDHEIAELRARIAQLEFEKTSQIHALHQGTQSPPSPKWLPYVIGGGVTFVAMLFFGAVLNLGSGASGNRPDEAAVPAESAASEAEQSNAAAQAVEAAADAAAEEAKAEVAAAPVTAWRYTTTVDEMTDRPTHIACVTSNNKVNLDWPYSDVTANLCIRQSPKYGLDTYVTLNGDGQILCQSYDGCTVKVRFGSGSMQSFSAADAADHSTNIIFITNSSRLIQNMKSADTTKVELPLYQAGNQVLEFPTAALEWPRPAQ